MHYFSNSSRAKLDTCHPDLQRLMEAVLQDVDITIICGVRSKDEQNEAYRIGHSQVQWPDSEHNIILPDDLSNAIDELPYFSERPHLHWFDKDGIWQHCQFVIGRAEELGIGVRSGADWDGDGVPTFLDKDETFFDGPHWELI